MQEDAKENAKEDLRMSADPQESSQVHSGCPDSRAFGEAAWSQLVWF